jgi:hypothetical protein
MALASYLIFFCFSFLVYKAEIMTVLRLSYGAALSGRINGLAYVDHLVHSEQ